MNIWVKLLLVLLFGAFVLPMWLQGPDGKPIADIRDWLQMPAAVSGMVDSASGLFDNLDLPAMLDPTGSSASESSMDATQGQFYRWQDDSGGWHFSDRPPAGEQQVFTAENLPEISNTMRAAEPAAAELPATTGTKPAMGSKIAGPLPGGVSKEAIEQMLRDSHEKRMGEHL